MRFAVAGAVLALALGGSAPALSAQGASRIGGSAENYAALAELRQATVGPGEAPPAFNSAAGSALVKGGTRREGTILMIVGVAGIITGLAIDESIVAIAGAGVAGFGLYLFLDNGGEITINP